MRSFKEEVDERDSSEEKVNRVVWLLVWVLAILVYLPFLILFSIIKFVKKILEEVI